MSDQDVTQASINLDQANRILLQLVAEKTSIDKSIASSQKALKNRESQINADTTLSPTAKQQLIKQAQSISKNEQQGLQSQLDDKSKEIQQQNAEVASRQSIYKQETARNDKDSAARNARSDLAKAASGQAPPTPSVPPTKSCPPCEDLLKQAQSLFNGYHSQMVPSYEKDRKDLDALVTTMFREMANIENIKQQLDDHAVVDNGRVQRVQGLRGILNAGRDTLASNGKRADLEQSLKSYQDQVDKLTRSSESSERSLKRTNQGIDDAIKNINAKLLILSEVVSTINDKIKQEKDCETSKCSSSAMIQKKSNVANLKNVSAPNLGTVDSPAIPTVQQAATPAPAPFIPTSIPLADVLTLTNEALLSATQSPALPITSGFPAVPSDTGPQPPALTFVTDPDTGITTIAPTTTFVPNLTTGIGTGITTVNTGGADPNFDVTFTASQDTVTP